MRVRLRSQSVIVHWTESKPSKKANPSEGQPVPLMTVVKVYDALFFCFVHTRSAIIIAIAEPTLMKMKDVVILARYFVEIELSVP